MAVRPRTGSPAKSRKWMSVHEMGDMLGLKKTDRYWLVHKNYFRTETLLGKMRVEIASFEKWYANQDWYHKVNGEAPGKELRLRSYSPKEIQEMLGTDNATIYEILKKNNIETVTVNERLRVPTDAFWDWYHSQSRYRTQEDRKKDAAAEAASLSMPEMARLLDVPRSTVYGILSSKKYAPLLDVIVIAGRRRVTRDPASSGLQKTNFTPYLICIVSCLILNMKNWSWKKNGNMRIISEDALQKQITARRKNVWSI